MAKNGYDQTYEDDRKENEETRALVKKGLNAVTPEFVKNAARYIKNSELDTDKVKRDTGTTTNPMGDKYKKGGKIVSKVAYKSGGKVRGCGIATKGLTKGRMV